MREYSAERYATLHDVVSLGVQVDVARRRHAALKKSAQAINPRKIKREAREVLGEFEAALRMRSFGETHCNIEYCIYAALPAHAGKSLKLTSAQGFHGLSLNVVRAGMPGFADGGARKMGGRRPQTDAS